LTPKILNGKTFWRGKKLYSFFLPQIDSFINDFDNSGNLDDSDDADDADDADDTAEVIKLSFKIKLITEAGLTEQENILKELMMSL